MQEGKAPSHLPAQKNSSGSLSVDLGAPSQLALSAESGATVELKVLCELSGGAAPQVLTHRQ